MGAVLVAEIAGESEDQGAPGAVGEFPAGADVLRDDADLHAAGLSSYGTVELMVRIEEEFGVEFPDALLTRATFGSVDALAAAVAGLLDRGGASAARADAA